MANKLLSKTNKFIAHLVTEDRKPCVFCEREVDDEIVYGKLYAIGNIQCHYFCVLLSCCLIQKGRDTQGLFGFMYRDILAEVERSKKHRCSYCGKGGATLGCAVSQCRKQFHLPCGRNKNAVSLFYGNYKTFCQLHVPKQQLTAEVSSKVKLRKQASNKASKALKHSKTDDTEHNESLEPASMCAICYEPVDAFPTTHTFWPPCCARDDWFHRGCVQRMALSAGKHYFKCPLCNDKEQFFDAVMKQGYYVPDRDAAWELEQNAFAEIYERPLVCSAEECKCPLGRNHDAEMGTWDVKLCLLCGSTGIHSGCVAGVCGVARYVCDVCRDIARDDADRLATCVEAALLEEQERNKSSAGSGPVMPSRMSLRRTKQRAALDKTPSSSRSTPIPSNANKNTLISRESLNLKPVRKRKILSPALLRNLEVTLLSPIKHLEDTLSEKLSACDERDIVVDSDVIVEEMRRKFMKPKPRSAKIKILNEIAEGLFNNILKDCTKTRDPLIEWTSPKKTTDTQMPQEDQHPHTPRKLTKTIPSPLNTSKSKASPKAKHVRNLRKSPRNEKAKHVSISLASESEVITNHEKTPNKSPIEKEGEKLFKTPNLEIEVKTIKEKTPIKSPKVDKEENISNTPILEAKAKNNRERTPVKSPKFKKNHANIPNTSITEAEDETNTEKEDIDNDIDEQSNSTFELPREFIADTISDDEFPITPNKLKTVDIQKDSSMEISENGKVVTVDLTQMASIDEEKKERKSIAFKFSPLDKCFEKNNLDLESFKNQYLNEVGNFDCKFSHNHDLKLETPKIKTVIDFAVNAAIKQPESLKRKIDMNDDFVEKKLRLDEKCDREKRKDKEKAKRRRKMRRQHKKMGMHLSFRAKNIQLKIRIRDERLKVKIKKPRKNKEEPNRMKQCVLCTKKESPILVRPDNDVVPKKRNYVKAGKTPDNWKQTSLSSFFCKKIEK